MGRKELLSGAKRIVVKIGTSTLTNADGSLNERLIKSLVAQICKLKDAGFCVALVSSGAMGAGMGLLGIAQRPKILSRKQALAAVGQVALMHLYERLFWAHDRIIAQLLLSRGDFSDRARYLSVRNVCGELLSRGIVPIINENDPVVADELKVGDNDTLSALVAGLIDADLLVILSDIDGLYDKNPSEHTDAKLLSFIEKIDERVVKMAGGEGSKFGTGGMATKIAAAQMANQIGTSLIIANGRTDGILLKIAAGEEVGTLFSAGAARLSSRKYWLAYGAISKGAVIIDAGAAEAIKSGKSLLAVGIAEVRGEFERGEIVNVYATDGKLLAHGISNYSSCELERIAGAKSDEIEHALGYKSDDDAIHADNIALQ